MGIALVLSPPLSASSPIEIARQLNEAFISVAETVSPSVVVIEVAYKESQASMTSHPLYHMLPPDLKDYFEQHRAPNPPASRDPVYSGRGSGIVIRENGFILTNSHVVDQAEKIKVRFADGRAYDAEVTGIDPLSDVAVIKIPADALRAAKLGESAKVRVGEFAIAIGAPFDLDYSVTFGHISAKGRNYVVPSLGPGSLGERMDQDFLQTDASINPGNSGGPLVNIEGQVIGINTLIRGMNTGIGFAIPIDLAKEVANKLILDGKYSRPWLGIYIANLEDDLELRQFTQHLKEGVVVRQIAPASPAANSELKPADIITSVDGTSVSTAEQLKAVIRTKNIGSPVTLDVHRNGESIKVKVIPGELPYGSKALAETEPITQEEMTAANEYGLVIQALTQEAADEFDVELVEGVIVSSVIPGSSADKKGIAPGDIITEINHLPVPTPAAFEKAITNASKNSLLIHIISGGAPKFVILKGDRE